VIATAGAAITVQRSYSTTLSNLWIEQVWIGLAVSHMANVITFLDSFVLNIRGPAGIQAAGGADGQRVDILQISRITTNNANANLGNASIIWVDIGPGTNTVRLDNVGLINGGTGVRMWSPANNPAGVSPGRPLFLLANDLEIDFPQHNAIELVRGEEFQLSNGYVQGGGSKPTGEDEDLDASADANISRAGSGAVGATGNGIYIGAAWNSELMVCSAIFVLIYPAIFVLIYPATGDQYTHLREPSKRDRDRRRYQCSLLQQCDR
jgi:hypothetical protein